MSSRFDHTASMIRTSAVLSFSFLFSLSLFRQVSNLSTLERKNTHWVAVLIEWKRVLMLLLIIKKHDTIDERRIIIIIIIIIIVGSREIERVNIYIWMEISDWKCSNERNQYVCGRAHIDLSQCGFALCTCARRAIDTNLFPISSTRADFTR